MKHASQILLPFILVFLFGASSCQSTPHASQTFELAASTENRVQVIITLISAENGHSTLSATFIPQDPSLHLYSKEIPKTGINGLGRPTLLELSKDSPMQAVSELTESVSPQTPVTPPLELLTYPAGPVTLSLPVLLPDGSNWEDDEIFVTYMACDETGCRPPVQNKSIAIKIPGKGLFQQ